DRQHTGHPEADWAHVCIGRRASVIARAATEHLAVCCKLYVAFQADNGFVFGHATSCCATGERCLCQSVVCSYAWAMRNTVLSSSALPTICSPTGRLFAMPAGTLMPGKPARLVGIVNRSFRYMANG